MAAGAAPGKWGMEVLTLRKPETGERRSHIFVDGSKAAVCEWLLFLQALRQGSGA